MKSLYGYGQSTKERDEKECWAIDPIDGYRQGTKERYNLVLSILGMTEKEYRALESFEGCGQGI